MHIARTTPVSDVPPHVIWRANPTIRETACWSGSRSTSRPYCALPSPVMTLTSGAPRIGSSAATGFAPTALVTVACGILKNAWPIEFHQTEFGFVSDGGLLL